MKAVPATTGAMRHVGGVAAQALLIAAIVALLALVLSPLYAPAKTITGTADVNAGRNGGGVITVPDGYFAGTTTATLNPGGIGAWAHARCYQDGRLVYEQWVKANGSTATFTLGPTPSWTSGYASCTAEEGTFSKNGRWRILADTTFNAWG